MWQCSKCGEAHEDAFDACWKCGAARGDQPSGPSELEKEAVIPGPDHSGMAGPAGSYRSAATLAVWVSILSLVSAGVAALAMLSSAYQIQLLDIFRFGGSVPSGLVEVQDARYFLLMAIEFGADLGSLIVFLVWVYRANRNARSLGADGMQYTPGWSVGWFFVPIMGLFMPYFAIKEIYQASTSNAAENWQQAAVSPVLGIWWAACVLSGVTHYEPLKVLLGQWRLVDVPRIDAAWSAPHFQEFLWGRLIFDLVGIAVSVLTVVLVVSVTNAQERRRAAIRELALEQAARTA